MTCTQGGDIGTLKYITGTFGPAASAMGVVISAAGATQLVEAGSLIAGAGLALSITSGIAIGGVIVVIAAVLLEQGGSACSAIVSLATGLIKIVSPQAKVLLELNQLAGFLCTVAATASGNQNGQR